MLKSHDIVAGVRMAGVTHLARRSDTLPKALVSVINYLLIRGLFRVPLSDFQNVVFYPRAIIQGVVFESRSAFSNPEALIKSYWQGCSIAEVPISFLPRQAGEAKGTTARAISAAVTDILRLWFRWVVQGRLRRRSPGCVRRLRPEEWAA